MANQDPGTDQDRVSALEMRVGALEDHLAQSTITPDDVKSYHKVAAHLQSLGAPGGGVWSCANVAGGPVWNCAQPAMAWSCGVHPAAALAVGPPVWNCAPGVWTCSQHPAAAAVGGPAWSCSPAAAVGGPAWSCSQHPAAAVGGPAWSCSPTPTPQGLADAPPSPTSLGGAGTFGSLGR